MTRRIYGDDGEKRRLKTYSRGIVEFDCLSVKTKENVTSGHNGWVSRLLFIGAQRQKYAYYN